MLNQLLNEKLNLLSKKVLAQILIDYSDSLNIAQKERLNALLSKDFVNVEVDSQRYITEKLKNKEDLTIPLAHGGRTFGDDVIHFYPFILNDKDSIEENCSEVLIHEIFHYFLRPEKLEDNDVLSSFITEGLTDMYTRDFCSRHPDDFSYKAGSNYGKNVLFVRDLLSGIIDEGERDKAAFSFDSKTLLSINGFEESMQKYNQVSNGEDSYTKLFDTIAEKINPDKKESIKRRLYNMCANYKTKKEMTNELTIAFSNVPENSEEIIKLIEQSFPKEETLR